MYLLTELEKKVMSLKGDNPVILGNKLLNLLKNTSGVEQYNLMGIIEVHIEILSHKGIIIENEELNELLFQIEGIFNT